MNFSETSDNSKNLLKFLKIAEDINLIFHLLLIINQGDTAPQYYTNQNNQRVKKFGLTRMRALEFLHTFLTLLFPTLGVMAAAQTQLMGLEQPECPHPNLELSKYMTPLMRRQTVKTMLVIMKEFSYCSIAN